MLYDICIFKFASEFLAYKYLGQYDYLYSTCNLAYIMISSGASCCFTAFQVPDSDGVIYSVYRFSLLNFGLPAWCWIYHVHISHGVSLIHHRLLQ